MISSKRLLPALLALLLPLAALAQGGPQLYNMGFDDWHKQKGVWYPYPKDAPSSQRIWDSGNPGLAILKLNNVTPEYEHVAVPGAGKAAARVESKKVAWAFVSGNLFNGQFIRLVEMKGVETNLGAPFTGRPKSISGWYHYIPKKINHTGEGYENMAGKSDEALIEVLLMDWTKPYHQVTHRDGFIDPDNDPHIIGRASFIVKKGTSGYVHFEAPIQYRNGKTPRYAAFTIASSRFGAYDTGAAGSVLYVDEFKFNY
jgi:hypothetical protein